MRSTFRAGAVALAVLAAASSRTALAQGPAPVATKLAVGTMAPDFSLRGATRYGLLANPVRLSDFRGQTVVIAFFYKARTKG